jgi:hypothetical protein
MAVFRFLAAVFMLVATIALAADVTPVLAAGNPFVMTPLTEHWERLAPASLAALKAAVQSSSFSWVWDGVIAVLIAQPTIAVFGVLALASGYLGRRKHRINIFVN